MCETGEERSAALSVLARVTKLVRNGHPPPKSLLLAAEEWAERETLTKPKVRTPHIASRPYVNTILGVLGSIRDDWLEAGDTLIVSRASFEYMVNELSHWPVVIGLGITQEVNIMQCEPAVQTEHFVIKGVIVTPS